MPAGWRPPGSFLRNCSGKLEDVLEPPVYLVGLSHKTAPVGVRECVAVSGARLGLLLDTLRKEAGEAVLISTCNRSELYLVKPRKNPRTLYLEHLGHFPDHLYERRGVQALRHLFRVASGLESQVVGEAQILGQVREALFAARRARATGPLLEQAFQRAVYVGKRARSETAIGAGAVSVAYAAVDLARSVFGDLAGHTALVLGAGEMAELVLTHLKDLGVARILVLNRTRARAEALANRFGGEACGMEDLPRALSQADIVIASAAAPHPIVRVERVREVLKGRKKPLFLIDIALPRNVEPGVGRLPGAYLYDLDALERVVEKNLAARAAELPRVERIVEEGLADYLEWYAGHLARDRIRRIEAEFEALLEAEIGALLRGKLAGLDPEAERALRRRVRRVLGKAAHALIQLAKDEVAAERLERALLTR